MNSDRTEIIIRRGTAKAFPVDAGQIVRLGQLEGGGQVADFLPFNRDNPAERLWGSKTLSDCGLHPTVGAVLVSTGPWQRPMMTIVADSLSREPSPSGAYFHDLVSCCSRKTLVERFGPEYNIPGCFELLSGAVAPLGIPPHYIHDCYNVFMRTGHSPFRRSIEACDAGEDAYVELRAEMDLLIAISACQGRSSKSGSRGLRVEIR